MVCFAKTKGKELSVPSMSLQIFELRPTGFDQSIFLKAGECYKSILSSSIQMRQCIDNTENWCNIFSHYKKIIGCYFPANVNHLDIASMTSLHGALIQLYKDISVHVNVPSYLVSKIPRSLELFTWWVIHVDF